MHHVDVIEHLRNVEYPPYRPYVTVEDAGSPEMLELIMSCWDEEPSIRPSFEMIKESIKKFTRGKYELGEECPIYLVYLCAIYRRMFQIPSLFMCYL